MENGKKVTFEFALARPCKGSVRYEPVERAAEDQITNNQYLNRPCVEKHFGVKGNDLDKVKKVRVTYELVME